MSFTPAFPPSITGAEPAPALKDAPPAPSGPSKTPEAAESHPEVLKRMTRCADLGGLAYKFYQDMGDAVIEGFSDDPDTNAKCPKSESFLPLYRENGLESVAHIFGNQNSLLGLNIPVIGNLIPHSSNKPISLGYVGVEYIDPEKHESGRRVVVAWRGTSTALEWFADASIAKVFWPPEKTCPLTEPVLCHRGFARLYSELCFLTVPGHPPKLCSVSPRMLVFRYVMALLKKYEDVKTITFVGHSLGGALATLSAFDIADFAANTRPSNGEKVPIEVYTFGCPRVGNLYFRDRFELQLKISCVRCENVGDMVPKVPGLLGPDGLFNGRLVAPVTDPWAYRAIGASYPINSGHSAMPDAHYLQNYDDRLSGHHVDALKTAAKAVGCPTLALLSKIVPKGFKIPWL